VLSKEKLLAKAIPGYEHRALEGFDLLINHEVLEHNQDTRYKRKPLDVLERELGTVNRALPPRALNVLRGIVIWVEWEERDDPDFNKGVVAKYYTAGGTKALLWELSTKKHPWKLNNVEITNLHLITAGNQPGMPFVRCVLLHELCHVIHFHLFGVNNPYIRAAYRQAQERKLYDESTSVLGRKMVPYARTNEIEYFADLSCAYLYQLDYYPHTRDDLKKHDPLGYKMMEQIWGAPKQLDATRQAEAEKVAARKLAAARKLQLDGKTEQSRSVLEKIIEYYPKTRSVPDAKLLLQKNQP
jgi:hypothetical protein